MSTVVVVSPPMSSVCAPRIFSLKSFCAWKKTSSDPFLSSNLNSLKPPPFRLEFDLMVDRVLLSGSA